VQLRGRGRGGDAEGGTPDDFLLRCDQFPTAMHHPPPRSFRSPTLMGVLAVVKILKVLLPMPLLRKGIGQTDEKWGTHGVGGGAVAARSTRASVSAWAWCACRKAVWGWVAFFRSGLMGVLGVDPTVERSGT
jgi:hypothetical protein